MRFDIAFYVGLILPPGYAEKCSMSSLQRYKKPGGFVQLVSLIETFGPSKKEKFLEMIDAEDAIWAKALRDKMLTLERIFQWPDQVVIEIFKNLPFKNMIYALEGLKSDQKTRMLAFFSALDRRKMDDVIADGLPKPEDMLANMVKLIELARKLLVQGDLRAERFDESILIPEEYESKLEVFSAAVYHERLAEERAHVQAHAAAVVSGPAVALHMAPAEVANHGAADAATLQRTLALVLRENRQLKDELRIAREKLEQIRKIA